MDTKGGRTQREGGHEGRKCDRPVPPLSSASGYFPSHMALHGTENTRHKGRKELNKTYESGDKLNPPGA